MSIALVQKAGSATGSAAFGSNNTLGNLLVAIIRNGLISSDTQNNTWVAANTYTDITMYFAANCKAGANTVSTSGQAVVIAEFSGVLATSPLDQNNDAQGTSNTYLSGSITTTQAAELLIGGVENETANSLTNTPGAGWTDVGANGDGNVFMNYHYIDLKLDVHY